MKILHLCRQYHPSVGGVERFVAGLAARLRARGHQVEVATLDRLWHDPRRLEALDVVDGIPVHRLTFVGGALFFVAPGAVRLARRFDLIHVHNTDFFLDSMAAARFVHRRPFVVSTHGGFFHTGEHAALKRLYFALITRHSLRAAAAVIPNSRSDARRFAPHARCAVRIDNAIDYAAFASIERRPRPGRVLTVGRLAPNKNMSTVLQVLAKARAARPEISLAVVGDGPLRGELQAQAEALGLGGAVRWAGGVDDTGLRDELAQAEVFVSAAAYEGFGLALLEAMAAGVVPVVNDIDAFRDLVDDGQTGYLASYAAIDPAVRALLQLLELPEARRLELSGHARAKASAFDWETTVPKFEQVYRQAAGLEPIQ